MPIRFSSVTYQDALNADTLFVALLLHSGLVARPIRDRGTSLRRFALAQQSAL